MPNAKKSPKLSTAAQQRLEEVIAAMQSAEEMGGTLDERDYIHLMEAVIAGCKARIATVRANSDCPALCWQNDGATYSIDIAGHRYTVSENGNEPRHSCIRWIAKCDGQPMSDGEPRCRDAKDLVARHAVRSARAAQA